MSASNIKKIFIGLAILFTFGALGYYMFLKNPNTILTLDVLIPEENQVAGQDILVLIEKLKAISIDASLFSSTLFTNLKDLQVPLNTEAAGRPNPFAVIGADSGTVPTNTRSSVKTGGI